MKELKKYALKNLIVLSYDALVNGKSSGRERLQITSRLTGLLDSITLKNNADIIVMSGEKKEGLDSIFGHLPIGMVAEYGAIYKKKGEWITEFSGNTFWKKILLPIFETAKQNCSGSTIEEKPFSLRWDFRTVGTSLAAHHSKQLIKSLENIIHFYNLKIVQENKAIEVMSIEINRIRTLNKLVDQPVFESIFFMGENLPDDEISENFTRNGADLNPFSFCKTDNPEDTFRLLEQLSA